MGRSAIKIELTLNGEPVTAEVEPSGLLLDLLREQRGLTGAKRSCEVQVCGACTVLVDGMPVSSCCYLAYEVDGRDVLTVEGFGARPEFAVFEEAFMRHAAVQCGYCTSGMLLTAKALLEGTKARTEAEIREGLSGNLCRCTGYRAIIDAVRDIASSPR